MKDVLMSFTYRSQRAGVGTRGPRGADGTYLGGTA